MMVRKSENKSKINGDKKKDGKEIIKLISLRKNSNIFSFAFDWLKENIDQFI